MLSLGNTYSYDDVREFYERVETQASLTGIAELKYDRLSVSLTYEEGATDQAVTRGDGQMGDDVTANVRTTVSPSACVARSCPGSLEVRGEILTALRGVRPTECRASSC